MIAAWGPFLFDIGGLDLDKLTRMVGARWHDHDIIGRRPAGQFLGPAKKTVKITGVSFPADDGIGGPAALSGMEAAMEQGQTYPLVDGSGSVFGLYRLEKLSAEESYHDAFGQPGRVAYSLEFALQDDGTGAIFSIWP